MHFENGIVAQTLVSNAFWVVSSLFFLPQILLLLLLLMLLAAFIVNCWYEKYSNYCSSNMTLPTWWGLRSYIDACVHFCIYPMCNVHSVLFCREPAFFFHIRYSHTFTPRMHQTNFVTKAKKKKKLKATTTLPTVASRFPLKKCRKYAMLNSNCKLPLQLQRNIKVANVE